LLMNLLLLSGLKWNGFVLPELVSDECTRDNLSLATPGS
jgi:hypothetical protein